MVVPENIPLQEEVINTYFQTSGILMKNLETFYLGNFYSEMMRSLENLRTSSELLGFMSISQKAKKLFDFLSQHTESDTIFFASKLSDLNTELRLVHSEWLRARESLEPLKWPQPAQFVAVCRRR
jgi:hypothetical protein